MHEIRTCSTQTLLLLYKETVPALHENQRLPLSLRFCYLPGSQLEAVATPAWKGEDYTRAVARAIFFLIHVIELYLRGSCTC